MTSPQTPSAPQLPDPDQSGAAGYGEPRSVRRRRLLSMSITYAIGTFNDNFFKQTALLLAAMAHLEWLQGLATTLFALPFVLFSAWAGWVTDRYPKRSTIIRAKYLEFMAMALGLVTLCAANWHLHWYGMVAVVFLMGVQSTFFSPALNGAIPENFSPHEVPKVNALLKLATTATILMGIAMAGLVLDLPAIEAFSSFIPPTPEGFGVFSVGVIACVLSVIGIFTAYGIGKSPRQAVCDAPFPLLGPVSSFMHAAELFKADKLLFFALSGEAFFYCCSSFVVLCINNLGVNQLGYSLTVTSLLSVALMVGIALGAMVAARYDAAHWKQILPVSGFGMSLGLMLAGLTPLLPRILQLPLVLASFIFAGLCGGIYLIPLISFIQIRPQAHEKGKVLGISNFATFSGIILSGVIFSLCGSVLPSRLLLAAGVTGVIFAIFVKWVLARMHPGTLAAGCVSVPGIILQALLSLRYAITVTGQEQIPDDGSVLFLPNHPALIDPVMVYALTAGKKPRPMADERQMSSFPARMAGKLLRAVLIPDLRKDGARGRQGVKDGIATITHTLRRGDSVLMYPSGRVYRSAREHIGGNSGTAALLTALPGQRVVLVRTRGLWGSSFSYAAPSTPGTSGSAPSFGRALLRGMLTVLLNGIFFTPRRRVSIEFVEPADLPRDGDKTTLNRYLEDFYNQAELPAATTPRYFWQGSAPRPLPEPPTAAGYAGSVTVPDETRQQVYALLRESAGLDPAHPLDDAMSLSGDLGLDSLAVMELSVGLEAVNNAAVSNLERLITVGDCVIAAHGGLGDDDQPPIPPALLKKWFAPLPEGQRLALPQGAGTIPEAFLALTRQGPGRAMLADRAGLRTRRDVLTSATVIAERLRALPGEHIGIMLPATPAVVPVWLAALMAGKTPVMFNWTVGASNLEHCRALTGVTHIVSATALLERLTRQGMNLESLPVRWLPLEALAASLSLLEKLRGALRARCMRSMKSHPIPAIATVLFTSGSESLPKAVPLSHHNLLTNAKDIISMLKVRADASVLAMLPPFHSFGLMVNIVLPLALGLRAAFHPNPTEPDALRAMVRDFRLSLMALPPTFLTAILEKAAGTDNLASLDYAFVGAEKCPGHVYEAFARLCPSAALCEGYGITECSPVVSVNQPGDTVPGSIGRLLPSVSALLVHEEDGRILGPVTRADSPGMLLLRGDSIFAGYLGETPSPFVEYEGRHWYRTGDMVSMDATGRLFFRGRLKRFVKIGGEMISLPQIESVLLEAFSRRPEAPDEGPPLAVEATDEDSGAEIVCFTPMKLSVRELNSALRAGGLSGLYTVKRVVAVARIPLLGTGKTDYRALRELL